MVEPNIETPVVAPAAPPAEVRAPSPASSKTSADRRAAAFATLPADMAAADREEAKTPSITTESNDSEEIDAKSEPASITHPEVKAEESKPEAPDPLAARAAQDRYLMAQREQLKQEREALAKERQEWEAKSKELPDPMEVETRIHRKVAADLVSYADEQKWTPQQRFEMAKALSWSAHPEDKRPAGWRGNGQGQVMSEVEQVKAELARVKAEQEGWKKSQAETQQKQEARQRDLQIGEAVVKGIPSDTPYVKAYAEAQPEAARLGMAQLFHAMVKAENEKAEREYRDPKVFTAVDVAKEYERLLNDDYESRYGWRAKVQQPKQAVPAAVAPKVPSAAAMAAPTQVRKVGANLSAAERAKARAEALALLPEKLD